MCVAADAIASAPSGTATTLRPGRAKAAAIRCATSAWSGRSGAGLAASAARSGAINGVHSSAASPARGSRRRPTTRPPAHANACTKRSSMSAASSTPLRAAAARSRPSARSHPLERLQLVAQLGCLLEPLIRSQRRHPHPQPGRRRAAVLTAQPAGGRRHRAGVLLHRGAAAARRRAPAQQPGQAAAVVLRQGRPAAAEPERRADRRRRGLRLAAASQRAGADGARPRLGRDGYPRHPLVGGQRQVAAALGVDRAAVRIRPQPQDQLQLEQRRLQLAAQRPRLDAGGRLQGVLHRRAAARSPRSTSAPARAGRWPCRRTAPGRGRRGTGRRRARPGRRGPARGAAARDGAGERRRRPPRRRCERRAPGPCPAGAPAPRRWPARRPARGGRGEPWCRTAPPACPGSCAAGGPPEAAAPAPPCRSRAQPAGGPRAATARRRRSRRRSGRCGRPARRPRRTRRNGGSALAIRGAPRRSRVWMPVMRVMVDGTGTPGSTSRSNSPTCSNPCRRTAPISTIRDTPGRVPVVSRSNTTNGACSSGRS